MQNNMLSLNQDSALRKVPPQNIEAEESLLIAILLHADSLFEIIEFLNPDDFYKTAHQKIYGAIFELFSKSLPIDLISVTNLLRDNNQLKEVGGASYLVNLVDTVPQSVSPSYCSQIIQDKATLRRLIEKTNQIARFCFEKQGDVDSVINFAENAIFEISENKNQQAFFPISKILDANIDALEKQQGNPAGVTGVSSGFKMLDNLTSGFQKSDLIIIAARPSMGKTALALNITRNAALKQNTPVAFFSLEMSKEQLSMRMLCAEARVDSSRLRGGGYLSQEHWTKLTDGASTLAGLPIFIDDSSTITVTSIRTKARRLKMDKGLGMVIVDYLQLMRGKISSERRDLEISDISRSLKLLAKELQIPVIALSQLNRKVEDRQDKRPQLADLRESGALEQDADVVAFIYRDEVYNKDENNPNRGTAEIILAKQRNGPVGKAHLTFLNTYTRFENQA